MSAWPIALADVERESYCRCPSPGGWIKEPPSAPSEVRPRRARIRSTTSPTTLLGVEAPAVRPTVTGPAGSQRSAAASRRAPPTGRWRIARALDPVGAADVVGRAAAPRRCARGPGCCCCCSRRSPPSRRARPRRASSAPRPAGPGWRSRWCRRRGSARRAPPRPSGRASPRGASPGSPGSRVISMVVWLARPMRLQVALGVEAGARRLAEAVEERLGRDPARG